VSYDRSLLRDFHVPEVAEKLFGRVAHIMSYRHFRFVGDDGHFSADLGPPQSVTQAFGENEEGFPGGNKHSTYYLVQAVEAVCAKLTLRSATRMFPGWMQGKTPQFGVGSHSSFLPQVVTEARPVRQSVHQALMHEHSFYGGFWDSGYAKYAPGEVATIAVNAALAALHASSSRIVPKMYDGQKLTQIQKMFKFLVPEPYVTPNQYEVSRVTSMGGRRLQLRQELAPFINLQRKSAEAVEKSGLHAWLLPELREAQPQAATAQVTRTAAPEAAAGVLGAAAAAPTTATAPAEGAAIASEKLQLHEERWCAAENEATLVRLCKGNFKVPYKTKREIAQQMGCAVTQITNALNVLAKKGPRYPATQTAVTQPVAALPAPCGRPASSRQSPSSQPACSRPAANRQSASGQLACRRPASCSRCAFSRPTSCSRAASTYSRSAFSRPASSRAAFS